MRVQGIKNDFSPSQWNKKALHPLQSWEWGEARKEMGIEVLRFGEFDGKTLQSVFQMTLHKLPYSSFNIGYIPRSTLPSPDVVKYIKDIAAEKNCIFVKFEPYIRKNEVKADYFENYSFVRSAHPLFPQWTQMLDLTTSEEDLMANMKSKTRYNTRLAKRKGVVVKEETNDKGFKTFLELYFDTTRRQDYRGHNREYHHIVFDKLNKDISRIFIAYYKDTPLAAYHMFTFNDVLYYPYGGSSTKHRNLMATNLLMWDVILFGKKSGCKKFDMWGSLSPDYDRSAPWSGFTRFKEGYGTEFVEFVGSYDLVLNPVLYRIYNVVDIVRKKFFM